MALSSNLTILCQARYDRSMPSLQTQAVEARKTLKAEHDRVEALNRRRNGGKTTRRRALLIDRYIVVLWGMHRGWPDIQIASHYYIDKHTVVRTRRAFDYNPTLVFRTPILHRTVNRRQVWRCEACGNEMSGTERQARTHVLNHFVNKEAMQRGGVLDEDRF